MRWLALWSDWRAQRAEGTVPNEQGGTWRNALDDLLIMLISAEEAHSLLERRYLGGQRAIFPDALAEWRELRGAVQALAGRGRSHGSLAVVKVRAAAAATAIAATTRAASLAFLGDSAEAAAMIQRRLQSAP